MRRPFRRLPALMLALSVLMTSGAMHAKAGEDGADKAMRASLAAFFAGGVSCEGAVAELKEVVRWPDTRGAVRWRLPNLNNHPERISLIAEQSMENNRVQRWFVPVTVHWWAKALVTTRELPARSQIQPEALKLVRMDVANINSHWWQDPAALAGTLTTHPLHIGQPVLSSYISRPALLRFGDEVTLISSIGGLQVKATGKVLRNAGIGDRVRVQNTRSMEIVQATILDAHTARVNTGGAS